MCFKISHVFFFFLRRDNFWWVSRFHFFQNFLFHPTECIISRRLLFFKSCKRAEACWSLLNFSFETESKRSSALATE